MRRALLALLLTATAVLAPACGDEGPAPAAAATAPKPVIVTLQFDDGAGQGEVAALLARHGLKGTFFINSGDVGRPGRFTWDDLRGLSAAGHEIGGHTVSHPHLRRLSAAAQQREICRDRRRLSTHGLPDPVSLAWPYGEHDAVSVRAARSCGWRSARDAGGLRGRTCPRASCPVSLSRVRARGAARYALPAAAAPLVDTSEATLRGVVDAAVHRGAGGWVQLFWHRLCDGPECPRYSWPTERLDAFLGWVAAEAAAGRVRVERSRDVVR